MAHYDGLKRGTNALKILSNDSSALWWRQILCFVSLLSFTRSKFYKFSL